MKKNSPAKTELPPLIDAFLEMMVAERGSSIRTVEAYRRDLADLNDFLSVRGILLKKAKSSDLQAYMRTIASEEMSPKTQARRLSAIHEFYRFLYSEDMIKHNPADYVQAPKIGKSLPKYLTEEEVALLIDTADKQKNKRMAVMLEILYASRMRVSELVGLPVMAVTRDNQTISVVGKGNKERLVPLNEPARIALDKWLTLRELNLKRGRVSKWLFPSIGKEGHLTRDGFFKALKEIALKAGIDPHKVSPHVFRHSFASHLIAHDADLRSVQKMLGHANIATTEIYTHILQDRLKKTVEKSHPLAYSGRKD